MTHMSNGVRGTLLLVTAHMNIGVAGAPVGQPMNKPRITVEGKNDRLIRGEKDVEVVIRKAVRVFARRLQFHEIHDVNDLYL